MQQSESIKQFAPAFLKAQSAIESAKKLSVNPHFKSKYADLSVVIDAVKAALNENEIFFTQAPRDSDDARLHMTTRLIHVSGEWIESTISIPLAKQDAQAYGSALTYARRYGLAAITGLPQEDDDGNEASKKQAKKAADKPISGPRISFERLTSEMQAEVKAVADQVEDVMTGSNDAEPDAGKAVEIIGMFVDSFPDDEDIKPAIWSCLGSKTRSTIKKYQEAQGVASHG